MASWLNQSKVTKQLKVQNKKKGNGQSDTRVRLRDLVCKQQRCWWKIHIGKLSARSRQGFRQFMWGKCLCFSSLVCLHTRVEATDCQVIYALVLNFGKTSYFQGQPHQPEGWPADADCLYLSKSSLLVTKVRGVDDVCTLSAKQRFAPPHPNAWSEL